MILETVVAAAAEAVFSYLLQESGLSDRVRARLGRDPARLAFQTGLLRALDRFAQQHPDWTAALLDETFLTRNEVAAELSRFLARRGTPDPQTLAAAWAAQLPGVGARRQDEATAAIADFLRFFEEELGQQEALHPLFDSRALERIAANTEALLETLRDQYAAALRAADRSVRIAGDVHNALIVTGDGNTVNYFAAPVRTLPTDYASKVQNFLDAYLGDPGHPVPFGGRRRDLAKLSAWLEDAGAPPYLLLTAPAGRGKSALLTRWAAGLQKRTDLAVVFAPISIRFNTNLSTVAFAILAAQLARVYGKKPPEKDETPDMWRGFVADTLRQPPPDDKRVVVVVDGLDEAADWEPGADLFPARPGERVRVVVSARLTATRPTPEAWRRVLGWEDNHRAYTMTLEGLTRQGIAEALASMGFPLDELGRRVDIVAELHRLTQGDPLLVRLYVDDLWAKSEAAARLQPEDLRTIEPGYAGYFARWWEDQRKLWGEKAPLKERAVREVFGLLACAFGPLTQDDLLALADPKADLDPLTLEETLRPIARFVVGGRKQGYSLAHPKLGEYFREEVLGSQAQTIEARFVAWARRVGEALRAGRLQPDKTPRYLLEYAGVHLAQAGAFDDLAALIESRAWYIASERHDPSRSLFAADVARALEMAAGQVERDGRVDRLPQVAAWSLLYATVRTLATNVPVDALEAMVLLGQADRALRYAALITDPYQQAEAYWRLGRRLHEQGDTERAREALRQALDAAQAIEWESSRPHTLARVARALVQVEEVEMARQVLERALDAAQTIEGNYWRADTLASVAQVLTEVREVENARQALTQALLAAQSIGDAYDRARALALVARILAQIGDEEMAQQVLEEALLTSQAIGVEWRRAFALANVAEALAQVGDWQVLRQALDMARAIEDEEERARALASVAKALAQVGDEQVARQALEEALSAARAIGHEGKRTRALSSVAETLAQVGDRGALHQVLEAAQAIGDNFWRAEALSAVVQALTQVEDREGVQQALSVARAIRNEWFRSQAMSSVAGALAQVGDREGALSAVQAIGVEWRRAFALANVARALATVEDREGVRQALAEAQAIGDKEERARALSSMAMVLAQVGEVEAARQALEKALSAVQAIGHEHEEERARALSWVAVALVQVGEVEVARWALAEALDAAQAIRWEPDRSEALAAVAGALAQVGDRERALSAAQAIRHEYARSRALAAVAGARATVRDREGVRQALMAAQAIGAEQWRADALASVAMALVQVGDKDTARQALEQALSAAQTIGDLNDRAGALASVAVALAQVGNEEAARRALAEALDVPQAIEDDEKRADALASVARALAQVGDREELRQVLLAAQAIGDDSWRADALAWVAGALAQVGDKEAARHAAREALAAAQLIGDEKDRVRALAAVVDVLAAVGDREGLQQALVAAQAIRNEWQRAEALAAVAEALTQVGEVEAARQALEEALSAAKAIVDQMARARALASVAQALAQVGEVEDREVAGWLVAALRWARARGREEVWAHIRAFAPVLAKLGVIAETWRRIQAVEAVVRG